MTESILRFLSIFSHYPSSIHTFYVISVFLKLMAFPANSQGACILSLLLQIFLSYKRNVDYIFIETELSISPHSFHKTLLCHYCTSILFSSFLHSSRSYLCKTSFKELNNITEEHSNIGKTGILLHYNVGVYAHTKVFVYICASIQAWNTPHIYSSNNFFFNY